MKWPPPRFPSRMWMERMVKLLVGALECSLFCSGMLGSSRRISMSGLLETPNKGDGMSNRAHINRRPFTFSMGVGALLVCLEEEAESKDCTRMGTSALEAAKSSSLWAQNIVGCSP